MRVVAGVDSTGRKSDEECSACLACSLRRAVFGAREPWPNRGGINKAVGGYTWEDAAKEAADTKKDGHLTFAIVTHTAGNGFFDPVYVGATVAANMIGAKILLLGSEVADRRSRARSKS